MADRWFYARADDKIGPFSGPQLRQLAVLGQILPTDTVWKEGIAKGVFAGKVKYLFASTISEVAAVSVSDPVPSVDLPVNVPPDVSPPAVPENLQEQPAVIVPVTPKQPSVYQPQAKKRRAVGVKGADIVNQDGARVQYRKKCTKCGHEDSSRSSMPIPNGTVRAGYFCPKCRKRQPVEIQGFLC